MKDAFKIVLSMLVVSIMLIGTVGAESADSTQEELLEDDLYLPDYGPATFNSLKEDSNVFEIRGTVPEITDDKEKIEWLDTLSTCIRNSRDELSPYLENDCLLFGFGVSYEGYIFVEFNEGLKNTVDQATMDKIYDIIAANGAKQDISDVPVVFRNGKIVELDSRTQQWTNMMGGIKILYHNTTENAWYGSTLSFCAEDSASTTGFVMSGHGAITADGVGGGIFQGSTTRRVGNVDYLTGHFADAAWVEAANVLDDVYYDDTDDIRDVSGYADPSLGSKVYKSGINTSLTYGYVTNEYIEVNSTTFGRLYDQFTVSYESGKGDSGAPVFRKSGSNVRIAGVHWGSNSTCAFFSPVSGVILDLDVTPLY